VLKGSHLNKAVYMDLLAMLYEILAKVRKEGLMSVEGDIENPESSAVFSKYPKIQHDHHVMEFICDYLRMMVGGNLNAFEIENLMDIEIETHHQEATPAHVMSKVADGGAGLRYRRGGDGRGPTSWVPSARRRRCWAR
jgi:chemotaxis protein MotA